MKCPHCGKDIPERLVVSEAIRIHQRKEKKSLPTKEKDRKLKKMVIPKD